MKRRHGQKALAFQNFARHAGHVAAEFDDDATRRDVAIKAAPTGFALPCHGTRAILAQKNRLLLSHFLASPRDARKGFHFSLYLPQDILNAKVAEAHRVEIY